MSQAQVKKIIKRYANLLEEKKFPFVSVYLYGSYASKKNDKHSDIDIAVVTKPNIKKSSKELWEQSMMLSTLTVNVDTRIEPILLTQDELNPGKESILGNQVRKYGIRIS